MLNNYQNLETSDAPTLNSNFTLVAKPSIITEINLFNLIENCYKENDIDKVKNLCELYKKYNYKKNLDKIKHFLEN